MSKIETTGTYIGTITESGYNETRSGLPQWVGRIKVDKKYVEEKSEIEFFQKQGLLADGKAGYVDYSSFDQDIVAFLVLYSTKSEKPTLNADQLFKATGWAFPGFDQLDALVGKPILFRVAEKKGYTDQDGVFHDQTGQLEVSWIDHPDTSPERQLKTLDADAVKAAMNKYKQFAPKPVAVKATPAAPAAVRSTPTLPAAAITTASTASASPASKAPPKRTAKKPDPTPTAGGLTQIDAWNAVNAAKGDAEDQDVEKAWMETCGEVIGSRDEASATGADWAKVRDGAIAKLAALVPA